MRPEIARYACNSPEHTLNRRSMLGVLGGGLATATSAGSLLANPLARQHKRVLMVFLSGGVSQLETWDPKPGAPTGGPFRAIPTSAPGVHICELLPYTASQMHRLALVRGVNTAEDDHGKGSHIIHTGRRQEPSLEYPHLGSVAAKFVADADNPIPGYLNVVPGGGGGSNAADAAFLGPRYGSVTISDGRAPANIDRPVDPLREQQRHDLRRAADQRFMARRKSAQTEAYTQTYDQALQLMQKKALFDLTSEPAKLTESYGTHDFGRHCVLARRLLEGGAPFVKISHTNYDTHHENFDFHIEQLAEFDKPFATLIEDLHQRGLLSTTLVMVVSEFGRTPNINRNYGRDHWSKAWSVALGGCGIRGGSFCGKTNAQGTEVVDRQVHGGHLFATYLKALGLDPAKKYYVDQRPIPMVDPTGSPIGEVLS
ncbi:MAG: DUF1501 domain-containing protein [Planctomycetota bacterium]|nr:MAG: DUF1501 domain-containing protein [Planctomycetota bacterium]